MRIARIVQQLAGVEIHGLATLDYNANELPRITYDGDEFPYEDVSFDVVVFGFMLHHTEQQERTLSEAKRVCRDRMIILEDAYEGLLGLRWTNVHDTIVNKMVCGDVQCPCTFRSVDAWKTLFRDMQLDLRFCERIYSLPINLQHQVVFVCSVGQPARPGEHATRSD